MERLDGDRVRSLRRRTGLTQAQLAQRAGVGESTIKRIEAGRKLKVHPATIAAVAGALRVETAELFGTEGAAPDPGAVQPDATDPFLGRSTELGQLMQLLDRAHRAEGSVCLIEGEPGVGKTRLAAQVQRLAEARGMRVLSAWCQDGEGAPSYWPWIQILRAYARDVPADRLRADLGRHAEAVLSIVPELHEGLPDRPPLDAHQRDEARFQCFDGVSRLLLAGARRQPLVLLIDDLHSADGPSLRLFEFLGREIAQTPLLLVGAHRNAPVDLPDRTREVLSRIRSQPHCVRLELRGLSLDDVSALVKTVGCLEFDSSRVRRIHERTGGNPLFVRELVRQLAQGGAETRVPDAVRDLLGSRVASLSDDARELLRSASIIGSEWSEDLVHAIAGLELEASASALDEALASGVIRPLAAPDRFGFVHALFREAVYVAQRGDRRRLLHQRAVEWLTGRPASVDPAEVAHHAYHSADLDRGQAAGEWTLRAAERAMSRLAYEDAADHYARGLELLERFGQAQDRQRRCALLVGLAEARMASGDQQNAVRAFLEAARLARASSSGPMLARVALGLAPGVLSIEIVTARDELVSLLRDALRLCADDTELSSRLHARLALALMWTAPAGEIQTLVDRAIELARVCGDPSAEAFAYNARFLTRWSPANLEERLREAPDLLARTLRCDEPALEIVCRVARFSTLLEAGDLPALATELEAFDRLAEELRQPQALCYRVIFRACLAMLEGRYVEMTRLRNEVVRIAESVGEVNARHVVGVLEIFVAWEEGRFEDALAIANRSSNDFGAWRHTSMHMLAECGRHEEAYARLRGVCMDGHFGLRWDGLWLCHMVNASETCVALEDTETARPMYEVLLPYRDRVIIMGYGWGVWGSAERTLGALAALLGDWEKSEDHFESALRVNGRLGARAMVVRTEYGYARMLLARNAAGDRSRARQLIDAARAEARGLGLLDLLRRLERL